MVSFETSTMMKPSTYCCLRFPDMVSYSRIILKLTQLSEASVSRNSLAVWVEWTPLELRQDQLVDRDLRNEAECLATRPYVRGIAFFFICLGQTELGARRSLAVFLSLLNSLTESVSVSMPSSRPEYL